MAAQQAGLCAGLCLRAVNGRTVEGEETDAIIGAHKQHFHRRRRRRRRPCVGMLVHKQHFRGGWALGYRRRRRRRRRRWVGVLVD